MKISIIEIQTITAAPDKILTNGITFSGLGDTIYLGCNDIPENWYEITLEEAEERWPEEFIEIEEEKKEDEN